MLSEQVVATMTEYSKFIDELLKPKIQEKTVVLDLFADWSYLRSSLN